MRKIVKNNRQIEVVISYPIYSDKSEKNCKLKKKINSYFKALETFLKTRYGDITITRDENCKEKKSHYHFLVAPICVDKDNNKEKL
jgi:hypothetical protein